ncbi:MAG: M48 family metalloprotease [Desulfuromonadales bacterium]
MKFFILFSMKEYIQMVKKLVVSTVCALVSVLTASIFSHAATQSPQNNLQWWKNNYMELTAQEDVRVNYVKQVFLKVRAVTDKSSGKMSDLAILKDFKSPYAAALPGGGIVLSWKALKTCYDNVSRAKGDARIAFIIGHELAHLSKDDFWHLQTFASIKEFAGGGQAGRELADFIRQTSDAGTGLQAKLSSKSKELQADDYGIVYMAMAGYDPRVIVDIDGTNFFREYVSQVTSATAYDAPSHPTVDQRAEIVRTKLAAVAGEIDLFNVGVRYFQAGRYYEAATYLKQFSESFPSREVYSNIGLAHYQLALESLYKCDPKQAYRYQLPLILDTTTLAPPLRTRSSYQTVHCNQDEEFRLEISEAITYLELARERDSRYMPALINLSSAYLIAGKASSAMAAADDALKLNRNSPEATIMKAISLHRFGMENQVTNASDKALTMLDTMKDDTLNRTKALYNKAGIESELGRESVEKEDLKAFLVQEQSGDYADCARSRLGLPMSGQSASPKRVVPVLPVPLGVAKASTLTMLEGMNRKSVVIGSVRSALYRSAGLLVVLDERHNEIELVEVTEITPSAADIFLTNYGRPRREFTTVTGLIWLYDGFAAEVVDNMVRAISFYR